MTKINVLSIIEKIIKKKWIKLTEIPIEIGKDNQLKKLYLDNSQLTELPAEIGQLTQIEELYLDNNQLTELPAEIGQLTQLKELYLNNNQLKELPTEIGQLTQLRDLRVKNNPIKKLLRDIAELGIEAIRNYFQSLAEQGEEYVYEAKLILVGEPGAGKTSLAKKLHKPKSSLNREEPMTRGIDIVKWKFSYKDKIQFTTNIWDFGGQHIMHATHRYFLTKRSLYIVLADNEQQTFCFFKLVLLEKFQGTTFPGFYLNRYNPILPVKNKIYFGI